MVVIESISLVVLPSEGREEELKSIGREYRWTREYREYTCLDVKGSPDQEERRDRNVYTG